MTLAELGAVMTIIVGSFTGACAAHSEKAGWLTALFAIGGFLVGIAFALASMKLANAALNRSIQPVGQRDTARSIAFGLLYCITPLLSMAAAGATTVFLTIIILSFVR